MGLWNTIRDWLPFQKEPRPVGDQLETGPPSNERSTTTYWAIRGGIFAILLGITLAAFPRGDAYEHTVEVGDTWRQQTLVAPFNFPVYKDEDSVRTEREEARRNTPPYFAAVLDAEEQMQTRRDSLQQRLEEVFDTYASFQYHQLQEDDEAATEDSLRYVELREETDIGLTDNQWELLLDDYVARLDGLSDTVSPTRGPPEGPRLDQQLLDEAYGFGVQLHSVGVMELPHDSILTEEIIIRNEEDRTQRRVSKDNLYGYDEAFDLARERLQDQFDDSEHVELATAFFEEIFRPSLDYLREETHRERERRAEQVSAIRGGVEQGEIIISQGERVSEEVRQKLISLERVQAERMATTILWRQFSGELLLSLAILSILFSYLFVLRREDIFDSDQSLLIVALLLGGIIALFGVVVRFPWISLYVVPVTVASVLLTIIFDSRIALISTLTLAAMGGAMLTLDLEFTLATFIAGLAGIFSVRDIKNRGQFFVTAVIVFVGYAVVLAGSWLYLGGPFENFGRDLIFVGISAAFVVTAYILLWIFERLFNVTTDLTLLELSDTNLPLLKELSLRAPGTFNHSLQVANLAEAAADRVGAHVLLTRVGALYHDIGKMLKPEYYVENQQAGNNPHDQLKPRMSALIIASHVKEGVEMGKEYGLPRPVLKFTGTHHGTSRIEYFYQKAVEQAEDPSKVLESEFRYPGPRPDSKETGILLLADSVEAASRSLDEPTHGRLKSLIDVIFSEYIEDGQLDNTDLTFRDLRIIKETFLSMLTGIYHVRIKYPDRGKDKEVEIEEEDPLVQGVYELDDKSALENGISVVKAENPWIPQAPDIDMDQLRKLSGVHDPKAPRPRLAEVSPHQTFEVEERGASPTDEDDSPESEDLPRSSETSQDADAR